MPAGGRLLACNVGAGCVLLAPPPLPRGVADEREASREEEQEEVGVASDDAYADGRPRCFLVQASGVLHLVRRSGSEDVVDLQVQGRRAEEGV